MTSKRDTTCQRHEMIFKEYERVIKEKGNDAPHISRKHIYDEVADNLGFSGESVRKVVCRKLKKVALDV